MKKPKRQVKNKVKKKVIRSSRKTNTISDRLPSLGLSGKNNLFKDFFSGLVLFIIVQAAFMIIGLFVERSQSRLINGIPSSLGLTLLAIVALILIRKKRMYFAAGMFSLAFLAPLTIFILDAFAKSLVLHEVAIYSLIYMALVVIIMYLVLVTRLWKGGFGDE